MCSCQNGKGNRKACEGRGRCNGSIIYDYVAYKTTLHNKNYKHKLRRKCSKCFTADGREVYYIGGKNTKGTLLGGKEWEGEEVNSSQHPQSGHEKTKTEITSRY